MVDCVEDIDYSAVPEWMKCMVAGCSCGEGCFASCRGCVFEEACRVAAAAFEASKKVEA
jgi:hypothetical protein